MKTFWHKLWKEEDGLGTLEILLIIAVLVAIAIVFRNQIIEWVNSLFTEADREMNKIDERPEIGSQLENEGSN